MSETNHCVMIRTLFGIGTATAQPVMHDWTLSTDGSMSSLPCKDERFEASRFFWGILSLRSIYILSGYGNSTEMHGLLSTAKQTAAPAILRKTNNYYSLPRLPERTESWKDTCRIVKNRNTTRVVLHSLDCLRQFQRRLPYQGIVIETRPEEQRPGISPRIWPAFLEIRLLHTRYSAL